MAGPLGLPCLLKHNGSMKIIASEARRATSWRAALVDRQNELWQRVRDHGEQRRQHLSERGVGWGWRTPFNGWPSCPSIPSTPSSPTRRYGIVEFEEKNHRKLRTGAWRRVAHSAVLRWRQAQSVA